MSKHKPRQKKTHILVPADANRDTESPTRGFVAADTVREHGFPPGVKLKELPDFEDRIDTCGEYRGLTEKVGNESPYFIVSRTPEQRAINAQLRDNGVRSEKIIEDLRDGTVLVEREGTSIDVVTPERWRHTDKKDFLANTADMLGTVHRLGVSHGHPHIGNIILVGERGSDVGLIDYDRAKRVDVDWADPMSVTSAFKEDYQHLNAFLFSGRGELDTPHYQLTPRDARPFYERLVGHYPLKGTPEEIEKNRRILVNHAVHEKP